MYSILGCFVIGLVLSCLNWHGLKYSEPRMWHWRSSIKQWPCSSSGPSCGAPLSDAWPLLSQSPQGPLLKTWLGFCVYVCFWLWAWFCYCCSWSSECPHTAHKCLPASQRSPSLAVCWACEVHTHLMCFSRSCRRNTDRLILWWWAPTVLLSSTSTHTPKKSCWRRGRHLQGDLELWVHLFFFAFIILAEAVTVCAPPYL